MVVLSVVSSFILLFVFNYNVAAKEAPPISYDQLVGFRVEPVIPPNQIDKNISYYYIKEKETQKDQLQFKIVNVGKKEKTVEMALNSASTNRNGLIVYNNPSSQKYLNMPINKLANLSEKEITVPAGETKTIQISLQMPKEKFKGISLGGIVVKEKAKQKQGEQAGINNIYSYTIGLAVTEEVRPVLFEHTDLKLVSVQPVVSNGYKYIEADILNPFPEIFDHVSISGEIKNAKGKTVLTEKIKDGGIAPQTNLPFSFPIGKEPLKSGKYLFEGKAKAAGKEWTFKQAFEITDKQAQQLNQRASEKYVLPSYLYWMIGLVAVAIISCFIFLLLRIKKRGVRK